MNKKKWYQPTFQKILSLVLFFTILYVMMLPSVSTAFSGLGGYIGEKILGDGTNNVLTLGDGTHTNQILASAPTVSTSAVSNNAQNNSATFNGRLDNLNGMPRANVWFEWGYSPLFLINTTPNVTVTTTGVKSVAVTSLTAGVLVYYRIASTTDGTSRGAIVSFTAGGVKGASYSLLHNVLLLVLAATIVYVAAKKTNSIPIGIAAGIGGLLVFKIIESIVNTLIR